MSQVPQTRHAVPARDGLRASSAAGSHQLWFLTVATFVAAIVIASPAAAGQAEAVAGVWLTEPGEQGGRARVEVRQEGDVFVGRIVWLEEPVFPSGPHQGQPKMDLENPDESLRNRPVLGLAILVGITYQGDGTWGGGTIYDPANGKTYSVTLSLDDPGDDTLDLRGYIGIPLFGRTTTWRRVE